MTRAIADTHAVIWYLYGDARLSVDARKTFEQAAEDGETIGVSTISLVEILYLVEKGRVKEDAFERIIAAIEDHDSLLLEFSVDRNVVKAMQHIPRDTIPDMPDRVIAATARFLEVPVISRDGKITLSDIETIW